MFTNRVRQFTIPLPEMPQREPAFVLMNGTRMGPDVGAIYRTAYLRAFATVEKRVIRRRQLHAAQQIFWN